MDKLSMQTTNMVDENIKRIGELFPNCLTERLDENGRPEVAIDFDQLRQELSKEIVEGPEERYQFTWPDKRNAIRLANAPTTDTLRPCREESVDFDNTQNLYIEGDNLQVLKLLRENYLGKVKMIYIDPPYNTGNDFVYNDDFSQTTGEYVHNSGQEDEEGNRLVANTESNGRFHTDWLNMIYPRLKVAKDLLSEDGVIFISIDDNELENLIKLGNEVFGDSNFVGTLSVENNPKGRKNSSYISVSSEYCVIYARKKDKSCFIENVPKKASDMTLDEDGKYVHNSGKRVLVGENSFNKKVTKTDSDKNYVVYYNSSSRDIIIKKESIGQIDNTLMRNKYVRYASEHNGVLIENTYTAEKLLELFREGALDFSNDKIYEKNFSDTIRIKSQLINREYEAIVRGEKKIYSMELTTTGGGTCLKNLFNTSVSPFPAPKNIGYLKLLISLFPSEPYYILDFFSGSATTAHAMMQLNAEDGGNRKFIMVQLPENLDESLKKADNNSKPSIESAIKICDDNHFPHLLTEIGKERIRRAGKKILEEQKAKQGNLFSGEQKKLDVGFRVLKLDSSNMQDVYYTPAEFDGKQLEAFADNIKSDRTDEDLLFQAMIELGIELSAKIEKRSIAGKTVWSVSDDYLMACFDEQVNESTIKEIAKQQPYYFVMRDSSLATDQVADNFEQIWEEYSKDTIRKII
jgi:adenine-specific DNA-methyltransferase